MIVSVNFWRNIDPIGKNSQEFMEKMVLKFEQIQNEILQNLVFEKGMNNSNVYLPILVSSVVASSHPFLK